MTGRLALRSRDPETTRAIAAAMAPVFRPGDVVSLTGELGAGKTCFVQGLARGLDVEGRVTSPTFMLVKHYDGRLPIVHCDVYRLDRLQDVLDLGDEVMGPDAVTLIEWGDAVAAILPDDHLEVALTMADDPAEGSTSPAVDAFDEPARQLTLVPHGAWVDRLPEVAEVARRWRAGAPQPDGPA